MGLLSATVVFSGLVMSLVAGLVGKEAIVGANSRLSASPAVAQLGGFAAAGWLVQFLTAPMRWR
jgi:hypothetical protein